MASGMNGQNFTFNGYLPIDKVEVKNKLKELERISKQKKQTQIFIETPYRNMKLLEIMFQTLQKSTKWFWFLILFLPNLFTLIATNSYASKCTESIILPQSS